MLPSYCCTWCTYVSNTHLLTFILSRMQGIVGWAGGEEHVGPDDHMTKASTGIYIPWCQIVPTMITAALLFMKITQTVHIFKVVVLLLPFRTCWINPQWNKTDTRFVCAIMPRSLIMSFHLDRSKIERTLLSCVSLLHNDAMVGWVVMTSHTQQLQWCIQLPCDSG